jgi:hypothetical protein
MASPAPPVALLRKHVVPLIVAVALFVENMDSTVIDLSLLRIPSLRAAVAGGFLYRSGIGAMPFLLLCGVPNGTYH